MNYVWFDERRLFLTQFGLCLMCVYMVLHGQTDITFVLHGMYCWKIFPYHRPGFSMGICFG